MRNYIPAYVVTGFLNVGKTSYLNRYLHWRSRKENLRFCVVQFESGEEKLQVQDLPCDVLHFSVKELEQDTREISKQIGHFFFSHEIDELWIEWNGTISVSMLYDLFLNKDSKEKLMLSHYSRIHKIIHVADADTFPILLKGAGIPLMQQVAESDVVIVRNADTRQKMIHIKDIVHSINPDADICRTNSFAEKKLPFEEIMPPAVTFMLGAFILIAVWIFAKVIFQMTNLPFDKIINVFLGILLEAFPFLLIGTLLSSAIQIFVPRRVIEQHFPKNPAAGMLFAIVAGFCLPACDCASVPIFRSMIRKGIPLSAAVVFMTVSPVINPVVILSTYYAFSGNWKVVAARMGLGILSSLSIGTIFAFAKPSENILKETFGSDLCTCGCMQSSSGTNKPAAKVEQFLQHSRNEFLNVGKYLLIAALISAVLQTAFPAASFSNSNGSLFPSLLIMMVLAFLLSMCSTADAVVARSFAKQFPMSALMGFLVFGPMMDLKNMIMLSGMFQKRWVIRFAVTVFACCFLVVFLCFHAGLGRYLP